jgi:hypothetical protein
VRPLGQRQLRAGKEDAAVDHGLKEATLARRTKAGEGLVETKPGPGIVENGKTAVIEGCVELDLLGWQELSALERLGDEIAGVRW